MASKVKKAYSKQARTVLRNPSLADSLDAKADALMGRAKLMRNLARLARSAEKARRS